MRLLLTDVWVWVKLLQNLWRLTSSTCTSTATTAPTPARVGPKINLTFIGFPKYQIINEQSIFCIILIPNHPLFEWHKMSQVIPRNNNLTASEIKVPQFCHEIYAPLATCRTSPTSNLLYCFWQTLAGIALSHFTFWISIAPVLNRLRPQRLRLMITYFEEE